MYNIISLFLDIHVMLLYDSKSGSNNCYKENSISVRDKTVRDGSTLVWWQMDFLRE